MHLYELADTCEHDKMKDEMICDRIVVGIWGSSLSKWLQLDPALTLETTKKAVCQCEAVHEPSTDSDNNTEEHSSDTTTEKTANPEQS